MKICIYGAGAVGGLIAAWLARSGHDVSVVARGRQLEAILAQGLRVRSGGKVEAFYYAYGEDDAFIIMDLPDVSTGLAISLTVNASGAVRVSTVPLITPEELDAASKKGVKYRAPGA